MSRIPTFTPDGGVPGGFITGIASPLPSQSTFGQAAGTASGVLAEVSERMIRARNQRILTERETELLDINDRAITAAQQADPAEAEQVYQSTFESESNQLMEGVPGPVRQSLEQRIARTQASSGIQVRRDARKRNAELLVERTTTQVGALSERAAQATRAEQIEAFREAAVGKVEQLTEFIGEAQVERLRRSVQRDFDQIARSRMEQLQELAQQQTRANGIQEIANIIEMDDDEAFEEAGKLESRFRELGMSPADAARAAMDTAQVGVQSRAFRLIDQARRSPLDSDAGELLDRAVSVMSNPVNRRLFRDPEDLRAAIQDVQDEATRVRQERRTARMQETQQRIEQIIEGGSGTQSAFEDAVSTGADRVASIGGAGSRTEIASSMAVQLAEKSVGVARDRGSEGVARSLMNAAKSLAVGDDVGLVNRLDEKFDEVVGSSNRRDAGATRIQAAMDDAASTDEALPDDPPSVNEAYLRDRSAGIGLVESARRFAAIDRVGSATDLQADLSARFDPNSPQVDVTEGVRALRAIAAVSPRGMEAARRIVNRFEGDSAMVARVLLSESEHKSDEVIEAQADRLASNLSRSVAAMNLAASRLRAEGLFKDVEAIDPIAELNRVARRRDGIDQKFTTLPPEQRQRMMDAVRFAAANAAANGANLDDAETAANAVRVGLQNFNRRIDTVRMPRGEINIFGAARGLVGAVDTDASSDHIAADVAALGINSEGDRQAFESWVNGTQRGGLRRSLGKTSFPGLGEIPGPYRPGLTTVFEVPGMDGAVFPVYQDEVLTHFVRWDALSREGEVIESGSPKFDITQEAFAARKPVTSQVSFSDIVYDEDAYRGRSVRAEMEASPESGGRVLARLAEIGRRRFEADMGRRPRPGNEADMRAILDEMRDAAREAGWPDGLGSVTIFSGDGEREQ